MEMSVYYLSGIAHVTMGYEKGKCLVYINVHAVHYEQIWHNENIFHSDLITDVYTHVNKTLC